VDKAPVEKNNRDQNSTPKVNLKLTTRTVQKTTSTQTRTTPDNSKVVNSTLQALRNNLSSATTIDMPGNSSAAAAKLCAGRQKHL